MSYNERGVENEAYQKITLRVVKTNDRRLVILKQGSCDKLRTRGGVERRRDCSTILYLKDLCTVLLRHEVAPMHTSHETHQRQPMRCYNSIKPNNPQAKQRLPGGAKVTGARQVVQNRQDLQEISILATF